MTMGEWMNKAVLVDGRRNVDDDERVLTLLEASDFTTFEKLDIARNFFAFTKNATYIFRFFEELAGERVGIDALDLADTYGDYAEHLHILATLRARYRRLCDERMLLDPVFVPELYRLNEAWLHNTPEGFAIEAEGYLTAFELEVIEKTAAHVPVHLLFESERFNEKMRRRFEKWGMHLPQGYRYRIDVGKREIIEKHPIASEAHIEATALNERPLQAAFVKQQVYEMIREGIAPDKIVVVLPEEGFASLLRTFDTEGNFNFAMGESLRTSRFVTLCDALVAYAEHASVENTLRLRGFGIDGAEALSRKLSASGTPEAFDTLLDELSAYEPDPEVSAIVQEERFRFARIAPSLAGEKLLTWLRLFANRTGRRTLDDVRGGQITVLGVLETRACVFDGVIIVDFNEAYVPHKNEKDMFINSTVREHANLPGNRDREALQKLFYHRLMRRAKRVEIAYVQSETSLPSRFLKELRIAQAPRFAPEGWARILLGKPMPRRREPETIEADYDFTASPLSATGLKHFLECRRRFYYRYVENVEEHRMPADVPEEHEIGNYLHAALSRVLAPGVRFENAEALRAQTAKALARQMDDGEMQRYLQRLWLRRLEPFFRREVRRLETVEIVACEKDLHTVFEGIRIKGRIDRIDRGDAGLVVLDYKTGKYPVYNAKNVEKAADFQLEFYALLAETMGTVETCGYYDLNQGEIVPETLFAAKIDLLKKHLDVLRETKTFSFEMTDNVSRCRYCAYAPLCGRQNA